MLPLPAHACALVSRQGGLWWAQSSLGREGDEGFLPPCCQQPPVQCRGAHGMGGDVWEVQAEEKSLGREGRRELLPASRARESRLAVPPHCCQKQTWRWQIFPLSLKKSKIPFFSHIIIYFLLLLVSSEAPAGIRFSPCQALPNPEVTNSLCQGLQPYRTRQTPLTSALLSK